MRHAPVFLSPFLSVLVLSVVLSFAQAAPATIQGSWSGSGIVKYRGGADRVRCRVRFSQTAGNYFSVSSQCATETGRYALTGRVASAGRNRYVGEVFSTQFNEIGSVVLSQRDSRLSATVRSRRGEAQLTLSRR